MGGNGKNYVAELQETKAPVSKSERITFYGLLAQLNEELDKGYSLNYATKNQLNSLSGYVPEDAEKGLSDDSESERPSCIDYLGDLVVKLRILNNRNDTQLSRLQYVVG